MPLPTIIAWLLGRYSFEATARQEVEEDSLLDNILLDGIAHSHSVVVAVDVCSDLVLVDRRQQLHPKETHQKMCPVYCKTHLKIAWCMKSCFPRMSASGCMPWER